MITTVGSLDPLTPAGVDALLIESTTVAGWTDSDTWTLRKTTATIELRGALPPVADPRHRELMLIGGAALFNVRVLTRVLGLHPAVQLLPDPAAPDLIAVVRPEGLRGITPEDRLLAAGIVLGSLEPTASISVVPQSLVRLLRRAAKVEHSWLALVPGDTLPPAMGRAMVDSGGGIATVTAVIGTVLDGAVARLQAGQATQRALLTANVNGVAARHVPAALVEPDIRAALRELIGGGVWPQAILRLGAAVAA